MKENISKSFTLFYLAFFTILISISPGVIFSSENMPQAAASSKQNMIGIVISIKGKAVLTRADGTKHRLRLKSPIYVGDKIETGMGAFVQVDFRDRSKVSLAGSSDFTVEKYSYVEGKEAHSEISIKNGALGFMAGEMAKIAPENYKVKTAVATIGIRGSSGEVHTSDGSLPGVPLGLQILKTAGKGLLAEMSNMPSSPVIEINQSGSGLVVNPDMEVKTVSRMPSLMQNYTKKEEGKVAQGRMKAYKEKKKTESENKKEAASSDLEEQNEDSTVEDVSDSESIQEESVDVENDDVSEVEDTDSFEMLFTEEDTDTEESGSTGGLGGMNMEGIDLPEEEVSEDPVNIEEVATEQETTVISEDVGATVGSVNDSVNATQQQEADQELIEEYEETIEEENNQNNVDLNGKRLSLKINADQGRISNESITVTFDETLLQLLTQSTEGDSYTLDLVGIDSQSDYALIYSATENGENIEEETRALYDNLGEFYLVNHFFSDEGNDIDEMHIDFFGKRSEGPLPDSGIWFYSSEIFFDNENSTGQSTSSAGDPLHEEDNFGIIGTLHLSNGSIKNPGFNTLALVDYEHKKVAGMAASFEIHNQRYDDAFMKSYNESTSTLEIPMNAWYGNLEDDASFAGLKFYRNLGYMPSHVQIPEDIQANHEPIFEWQNELASNWEGTGSLYGTNQQGLGLSANDTSGASDQFIAAAFLNPEEDEIEIEDGLYKGFGRGLKIRDQMQAFAQETSMSNLSLNASYSTNTLTGSFQVGEEEKSVEITDTNFAVDSEILFGELETGNIDGLPLMEQSSFLMSMSLPELFFDEHEEYPDLAWGVWNLVEDGVENIIYPGQQNFWVAGVETEINTLETTLKDRLDASASLLHYEGVAIRTLVDPTFSISTGYPWLEQPLWQMGDHEDFEETIPEQPMVRTDLGRSSYTFDLDNQSFWGLNYFNDGNIVVVSGQKKGSINDSSFQASTSIFSLNGLNNQGLDPISAEISDGESPITGAFVGEGASSLIFAYDTVFDLVAPNANVPADTLEKVLHYGVGIAQENREVSDETFVTISGSAYGVLIDRGTNSSITVTNQANLDVHLTASPSQGYVSGALTTDGFTEMLITKQSTNSVNTYVHKDAFLTTLDPSSAFISDSLGFAPSLTESMVDGNNSFLSAVPGLEGFEHISWGVWAAKDMLGSVSVLGYAGLVIQPSSEVALIVPNFSELATRENPIVTYRGVSMATIYTDTNFEGQRDSGTVVLDVNFNTAGITGFINLDHGMVIDLQGAFDSSTGGYAGSAFIQGTTSGQGGFNGQFVHDETVGVFGASDGQSTVNGAFGAKAEENIPLMELP
ncbi:MAG: hypothetical protein CMO81_10510 [Waddliaceae bacterium]|nr:hypothetical protein [Waddliaceae bacterium]